MHINVMRFLTLVLPLLQLLSQPCLAAFNVNDQQHSVPKEKVLPQQQHSQLQHQQEQQQQHQQQQQQQQPADDYNVQQHDKSTVEFDILQALPFQSNQQQHLRHGQHHLRQQDKYQLAWEPQELFLQASSHHQHKSQSARDTESTSMPPPSPFPAPQQATPLHKHIDYTYESQTELQKPPVNPQRATNAAYSGNQHSYQMLLPEQRQQQQQQQWQWQQLEQNRNGFEQNQTKIYTFTATKWREIEEKHRQLKHEHEQQVQNLRQLRNMPTKSREIEFAGMRTDDVRSAVKKSLEDTDGHDADNIFSRNIIAGKLTHQKAEQLGSPEAVLKSRILHGQNSALADAHWREMSESTCHVPQKRYVRIQLDPSKIYTPHCTALYRCTEDSGCCESRTEICAPKRIQNVQKTFHVKSPRHHRTITETLTLVNHTECHCIERSNYDAENLVITTSVVKDTLQKCNCPRLFEKILQNDGQCRCDCSSSNYHCDFLKSGSEHFSMNDRKCIQQKRCKAPTCKFGNYMDKHGRCPNHNEQTVHHLASYNLS